MAKLAIVFCLLIAGTYAASVPSIQEAGLIDSVKDKVAEYQEKIEEMIKNTVEYIQEKVDEAFENAGKIFDQLQEKAQEIVQGVVDQINGALKMVDDAIAKMIQKDPNVDVTECTQLAKDLHESARAMIANVTSCATNKVEEGKNIYDSITDISQDFVKNLLAIGDKAHKCSEGHGFFKSIGCVSGALKDATFLSVKEAPKVVKELVHATYLIGTLAPSLTLCTMTKSVTTFIESVNTVLPSIEACIEQKIAEVQDRSTTGFPSTHFPTTHAPSTHAPTTHAPTTHAPTTHAPTTHVPTTKFPLTTKVAQE